MCVNIRMERFFILPTSNLLKQGKFLHIRYLFFNVKIEGDLIGGITLRQLFTLILLILLTLGGLVACTSELPIDNNEQSQQKEVEQSNEENDEKQNNEKEVEYFEFHTDTEFTLEDIEGPFSKPELLLQPQGEDDYPSLNGVEAKAYQLNDGTVFIHLFKNKKDLKDGIKQIKEVYEFEKWGLKVYEVNNMMFVYMPANATEELIKENDKKIKNAIEEMIKVNNAASDNESANTKEKNQKQEARDAESIILYENKEYGFTFSLPKSWKGYQIVTDSWEGIANEKQQNKVVENGSILSIRHPEWTEETPRQDIPIMVFTLEQWSSFENGEFYIGAAPIPPRKLGQNNKYVFVIPPRYNYAFPKGYKEVEDILENYALKPMEVNNYNQKNIQGESEILSVIKEKLKLGLTKEEVKNRMGNDFTKVDSSIDDTKMWRYDIGAKEGYIAPDNNNDQGDIRGLKNGDVKIQLFIHWDWNNKDTVDYYSVLYLNESDGKIYSYESFQNGEEKKRIIAE